MPLQNRVTPFSDIEANPARGTFMGNRGILHDHQQNLITTKWKHKAWVCCVLSHTDKKGRIWHRKLMQPNRYTELFFLDEATALAAGHRPCALCRRQDYNKYRQVITPTPLVAPEIDRQLHLERSSRLLGKQNACRVDFAQIPDGAMFAEIEHPKIAILKWRKTLWRWSHVGYKRMEKPAPNTVEAITPLTSLTALANGYKPQLHRSITID